MYKENPSQKIFDDSLGFIILDFNGIVKKKSSLYFLVYLFKISTNIALYIYKAIFLIQR